MLGLHFSLFFNNWPNIEWNIKEINKFRIRRKSLRRSPLARREAEVTYKSQGWVLHGLVGDHATIRGLNLE
jgi:hypothetical protein